ncbi:MAG: EF-hand domain-containing protein [Candidatus Zixiibacteriota bacterium]
MIGGIQNNMSISSDMMLQRQQEMFERIDQNSDGQLDQSELQAMADEMSERGGMSIDIGEMLASGDTDGDNMISLEEFQAMKPPKPPEPPTYNLAEIMSQGTTEESQSLELTGALLDILG